MASQKSAFPKHGTIARIECMSIFSGDAFPGTLTMSTRRLYFQPMVTEEESTFSWELPITEIDLVTFEAEMGRQLIFP